MLKQILLLIFIVATLFCSAINISTFKNSRVLENHEYQIIEDTSNSFTLNDAKTNTLYWENLHYYRNLKATYWLKYSFFNDTKKHQEVVYELIDPHIDEITFYKGDIPKTQGFLVPFNARKYRHKNHLFEIGLQPDENIDVYVKIKSNSHIAFSAKLQTYDSFINYALNEYFFLGLFYGFLLIMSVYNLILFVFTRMSTRVFYALYVLGAALNAFTEDGLGFQYIWPNYPIFNHALAKGEPIIYLVFYIGYAFSFLDLIKIKTRFKTILLSTVIAFCFFYIIGSAVDELPNFWLLFYLIPFLMILYYSIQQYKNNHKDTRFLIVGTVLIIISFFLLYLRMLDSIPNSYWVVYFFNFSVTIEIILFSIAVGDKLRVQQNEHLKAKEAIILSLKHNEELKDKVNRELEAKVSERTEDLNEANLKLQEQATAITEMNLKLDSYNRSLEKKVVEVSKKRVHGTDLDPQEFHELYPDKLKCFLFLEEIKWSEGFKCSKCANITFNTGTSFRSRRCTKCGKNETPTSGTIFHGLRISIESAFYIFALVIHSKGAISSSDLEKKTGVSQKACWSFKQKITDRLNDTKRKSNSWKDLIF